jgi:hypothetical protein
MSTVISDLPAGQPESVADNLVGMGSFFVDPAGAARRIFRKWFWVGPLIVFSIVSSVASYLMLPIIQHVMEVMPIPAGADPGQFAKGMAMSMTITRISMFLTPVVAAIIFLVQSLILYGSSSVMGIEAKFRPIFNLVAGCSLIQLLSSIAALIILKAKGEVSSTAELRPALGLDIFMPEGSNKYLTAFLGYFSVFELWWIVMMVLIFSSAFRVSKGKAFAAVAPWVFISLAFRVGSALLQKS